MKADQKKQFDEMLDREILRLLSHGRLRASQIADAVMGDASETWSLLAPHLLRKCLIAAIVTRMGRLARNDATDSQLPLPGFERLPLIVSPGRYWIPVAQASLPELTVIEARIERSLAESFVEKQRERRAVLKRDLAEVRKLMRVMRFYSSKTAEDAICRMPEYEAMKANKQKAGRAGARGRAKAAAPAKP